jgi:hypothetical protein
MGLIYVKLDTRALTNGKFLAAGPLAFALYVKGLLYAKDHMTDGLVPHAALPLLTLGMENAGAVVESLVSSGLWERTEGGYTVGADRWAEFQQTKAQVDQSREEAAERKRRSRERHKDGHADVTRDIQPVSQNVTLPESESESESEPESDTESEPYSLPETEDEGQPSGLPESTGVQWYEEEGYSNRELAEVAIKVAATRIRSKEKRFPYRGFTENDAAKVVKALADCPTDDLLEIFWGSWYDYHTDRAKAPYKVTGVARALCDWASRKAGVWATHKRLQGYQQERQPEGYSLPKFRPGGSS